MLKAYEHNAGIIRHLGKHNKKKLMTQKCDIVAISLPMIDSDQYQMSF